MSSGWVRRSALALVGALALAVVSGVGPSAQQASATSTSKLCWVEFEDGRPKVYCVDIVVGWPWDEILDCWVCGVGLDWRHDPVINESLEGLVGQQVVNGLSTLGSAAYTTDPRTRATLRARALEQFTAGARYAGESRTTFAAASIANPEIHSVEPFPDPWAEAAGIDVADGITLLQQAARDPRNAARLRGEAMVQFDEAYVELSEHRVIG